jgi:PIN domain nuclease of toxin-antitoxin system
LKLLLDTHCLVWWLTDDAKLSADARVSIADQNNDVFVSAASAWELSTKARSGRWGAAAGLIGDLPNILRVEGFQPIAITLEHALLAGALVGEHRDPFDRMLVAQAQIEGMHVVSLDDAIGALGAMVIW